MAQTQIADLVGSNPGALANVVNKTFAANNSLITSGLAVGGPEVDLLMTGGSYVQGLNYVNKVDTTQFNYSSDNYDEKGATGKITASPYMALRHDINWGWAYTDLVRMITKYDVKGGVTGAVPLYLSEVSENLAVAAMNGALGAAPELVLGEDTDAFDLDALIDAGATMADPRARKIFFGSRKTIAKLQKMNKSAYQPASETGLAFDVWANHFVIQTEEFGDSRAIIGTEGAFAFGTGLVPGTIGMETQRDINAGNGGGGEILRVRLSIVASPQGFSWKGAAKPGLTGLANAANWELTESDLSNIGFRAINFAA